MTHPATVSAQKFTTHPVGTERSGKHGTIAKDGFGRFVQDIGHLVPEGERPCDQPECLLERPRWILTRSTEMPLWKRHASQRYHSSRSPYTHHPLTQWVEQPAPISTLVRSDLSTSTADL
jgi:hypothetical protein